MTIEDSNLLMLMMIFHSPTFEITFDVCVIDGDYSVLEFYNELY